MEIRKMIAYSIKSKKYYILLGLLFSIIFYLFVRDQINVIRQHKRIQKIKKIIEPITTEFMTLVIAEDFDTLYEKFINKEKYEKTMFLELMNSLQDSIGNIINYDKTGVHQGGWAVYTNYIITTDKPDKYRAHISFSVNQYSLEFEKDRSPCFYIEHSISGSFYQQVFLDTAIVTSLIRYDKSINRD